MTTDERLEKTEKIIAAMAFTIESHDRQLGLLIKMAGDNVAAAKKTDERIEKLVSGIGEFIRAAADKAKP